MSKRDDILERVRADKDLLSANGITNEELEFLGKVDMFGTLKSVSDILFILELSRHYRAQGETQS
ncbi:MAG: hypothetical protein ACHQZS_03985 [Candidatus Binatales bacterium]|jgi:hypothetical protein